MHKDEQIIAGLWNLFNKKVWLDNYRMKAALKGYKPSEIHCIEYVGENEDTNVTKLAESFYMTRGAASKITKKLMEKDLISSYQKPDNKKEIYFRLTEEGKNIYHLHENLHKEFQERDKAVFDPLTDKEYDIMLQFAERYNQHLDAEIEKLGVNLASENYDKL